MTSQTQLQIPMTVLESSKSDSQRDEAFEPLPDPVDFAQFRPNPHYQLRALARRSLSYHRRQPISTAICLVIWPIILVVIVFAISLSSATEYSGLIRQCTNEANPQLSREFSLSRPDFLPEENRVINTAYYDKSEKTNPCVRWFGETYPIKAPFQNKTFNDMNAYYIPSPDFGWWNTEKYRKENRFEQGSLRRGVFGSYIFSTPAYLTYKPIEQKVNYYAATPEVANALGIPPKITRQFFSEEWPTKNASVVVYNASNPQIAGTGLLGAMPIKYVPRGINVLVKGDPNCDWDDRSCIQPEFNYSKAMFATPYYEPFSSRAELDQTLLKSIEKFGASRRHRDDEKILPFGSLVVDSIDASKSSLKMTMQYGLPSVGENDDYSLTKIPSAGLRYLLSLTQFTNSLTKTKFAGKFAISQGVRALPSEHDISLLNGKSLNDMAASFIPFALSFLLPSFVSILVQEKEDKHKMMMAMNGLKSSVYYAAHYLEFITMQLILTLVFALACTAIKFQYIWRTSPGLLIVLFLVWAHVQVSLSFLVASFFSKTRKAALVVYFLVALSCIMAGVADYIFANGIPFAWYIHPTFAFFSIISTSIRHASLVNDLYPLTFEDFAPGTTLFKVLILLIVLPSEYGVRRPWHFPVTTWFRKKSTSTGDRDIESRRRPEVSKDTDSDSDYMNGGDEDVRVERERVQSHYDSEKTPLIIDNLYHRYSGKIEPALRGMSFGVETNTVLGLLGPNGAGKSTMIHLLTGLYEPTSGTAYVAGANIRSDMNLVHSQQKAVAYALASVSMSKFRDRQVKGLSGGEKRRVTIAISLLGDNKVIFLDEPTTGLDPAVRRIIWDIINRVKVNRTVILTTHSMEEADILSDRIAIMTGGSLRCIGTSLHLKDLYGTGFRLNITSKPGRLEEACQSIEQHVMSGMKHYKRTDKFTNSSVFEFELQDRSLTQGHNQGSDRRELSSIFGLMSRTVEESQWPVECPYVDCKDPVDASVIEMVLGEGAARWYQLGVDHAISEKVGRSKLGRSLLLFICSFENQN
ncbi:hypothetical protein BGW38_009372 [Lunasporangiospora selenospora]|uniref:ABC transporter domain-containing protein n=1 Tax=Lunasporangiospora selenospora TaxID=979761 RepID=A0A9P6KFZ3_9FUNG|nr:hypothetical protein BGW38_009372 [Lunasporangiospora selenospora]